MMNRIRIASIVSICTLALVGVTILSLFAKGNTSSVLVSLETPSGFTKSSPRRLQSVASPTPPVCDAYIDADTCYRFKVRHSGLYLMTEYGSTAPGAKIVQGNPRKQEGDWTLTSVGDSSSYFHFLNVQSSLALNVAGNDVENGAKIVQWGLEETYPSPENDDFCLESTGDGFYRFVARHSYRVIDIQGASYSPGAKALQWDKKPYEGANQEFELEPCPDPVSTCTDCVSPTEFQQFTQMLTNLTLRVDELESCKDDLEDKISVLENKTACIDDLCAPTAVPSSSPSIAPTLGRTPGPVAGDVCDPYSTYDQCQSGLTCKDLYGYYDCYY